MKIPTLLKTPTVDAVKVAENTFDKDNEIAEKALDILIRQFPDNTEASHVLLKVVAINALYHTQIFDVLSVAKLIVSKEIDQHLTEGNSVAVEKIARITLGTKERYNYSFATKYCSWHNQTAYPIFDSRVERCLRAYAQLDKCPLKEEELWDYQRYREAIHDFMNRHFLSSCTLKQIDKFLYSEGTRVFHSDIPEPVANSQP